MSELSDLGVIESGEPTTQQVIHQTVLPQSHEERLELTQGVRMKLVNALASDGIVPTDKEGVVLLLSTLKDMDGATLGAMRQKTDNMAGARDQLVAQALIELAQRTGGRSMLRTDDPVHRAKAIRPDDSMLPDIHTVPGETETGTHAITYGELAGKFSRTAQQLEHNP